MSKLKKHTRDKGGREDAPFIAATPEQLEKLREASRLAGDKKKAAREKPETPPETPAPAKELDDVKEAPPPPKTSAPEHEAAPQPARVALRKPETLRTALLTSVMPRFALQKCPKCRSLMRTGDLFCVKCGYNTSTREFAKGAPSRPLIVLKAAALASTCALLLRLPFIVAGTAWSHLTREMSALWKAVVSACLALLSIAMFALSARMFWLAFLAAPDYEIDSGGAHVSHHWREEIRGSASWARLFDNARASGKRDAPFVTFKIGFRAEKDEFNLMDARKTYTLTVIDNATGDVMSSEEVDVGGQTVLKEGGARREAMMREAVERAAVRAADLMGASK